MGSQEGAITFHCFAPKAHGHFVIVRRRRKEMVLFWAEGARTFGYFAPKAQGNLLL